MSLDPCPIALEPKSSTSPAFRNALSSVRRSSRPPPYELVRHSVLARFPPAPFGHRFWLPAADASLAPAATNMRTRAKVAMPRLSKRRAHKEALGVALGQGIPDAVARDQ